MECAVFVDAGWTASVVPDLPILRRPDFSLQLAKLQFKRRRIVEIQHGRVAWLQVLGLNMLNHVKTRVLSYRNRRKVVDKP